MSDAPPQNEGQPGRAADGAVAGRAGRAGARGARPRRRRLRWHLSLWMLVWLGLTVVFLVLASMSLTGRMIVLPQGLTQRIEAQINAEIPAGHVRVGQVEFGVSPNGRPRLELVDVSLSDQTGLEIGRLHRVTGAIRGWALLEGRIVPARIEVSGAEFTIRRRVDGTFDLSFGAAGLASGNLATVLDGIDRLFATGPLDEVDEVLARDLTITLEDARSGRIWQVTEGRLKATQTARIVDMTLTFAVFNQTENLAEVVMGFRTDKATSAASITATFENAAARDIAAQSPVLAFLGVLDAPISGALRTQIDPQGALSGLAGTLSLGAGALSPAAGAAPVYFDHAKLYIDYKPESQRLDLVDLSIASDLGDLQGSGHAYLRDYNQGWPTVMLGQVALERARINPGEIFDAPLELGRSAADFRLRLDPFTLEVGQAVTEQAGKTWRGKGLARAATEGWDLAVDLQSDDTLTREQVLALWPGRVATNARQWSADNVLAIEALEPRLAWRKAPGEAPRLTLQAGFAHGRVRALGAMAPIEEAQGYIVLEDNRLTVVSEGGYVPAPSGVVDIAGTVFSIPDTLQHHAEARIDAVLSSPVRAALETLAAPPFSIFRNSNLGPDLATGQMRAQGHASFRMKPHLTPADVAYRVSATLSDLRSDKLIPGHVIKAREAQLEATQDEIAISGAVTIGEARARGTWRARLGPKSDGTSHVEGELTLDQGLVRTFKLGLPRGAVSGAAPGALSLTLAPGKDPRFTLRSDLVGLALAIPDLGWRKPASRKGKLEMEGTLGARPVVEHLRVEAPGLTATGHITTAPGGGLGEARFDRVRLGGWLDAPVRVIGRGPGRDVGISIEGGWLDMRKAAFSGKPGATSGQGGGAPLELRLDRLIVSDTIALTSLHGTLDRQGGLHGTFVARVNGGARVEGTVAPLKEGSAVRLTSADGGAVMRDAGVFQYGHGGDMTLVLAPLGDGSYEGDLTIEKIRVVGASPLADLLSALSIVGLLEQLGQEGIAFGEVTARFRLTPDRIIVTKGAAIGASLGVSLDGTYELETGKMDFAGVVSPLYLLNGIGQIFTRRGEGLVGFTYEMKGTADDVRVSVNPLSILTPAFLRELFRKPPPKVPEVGAGSGGAASGQSGGQ